MTMVVCCFPATRLSEEYCQHASQTHSAELELVSGLQESSKGGTGHGQPERMPAVDGVMYREVVPDFSGVAA